MKIHLLRQRSLKMRATQASPKARKRKGSFLVESSVALFLLVTISFVLVKASLNILQPRSYVMKQNMADAFLSQEVALMNRVDFDEIADGSSDWGAGDVVHVGSAAMAIGKLPNFVSVDEGGTGRTFSADLYRVRIPLELSTATPTFAPTAGSGVFALGNLGIRAYKLQSHLVYSVDNDQTKHVKTRTVVRSQ